MSGSLFAAALFLTIVPSAEITAKRFRKSDKHEFQFFHQNKQLIQQQHPDLPYIYEQWTEAQSLDAQDLCLFLF